MAKAEIVDPIVVGLARRGLGLLETCVRFGSVDAIGRADLVASQALVQARNTLRAAWLVLFDGFEVQSLALARLVVEYLVLVWYARSGIGDPHVWLQTDNRPPSTGEQLQALGRHAAELPELAPLAAESRKFLHRFAHQDPMAFAFAYRIENDRPSFFRAAGELDALSLRRAGEYLLPLTVVALQTANATPDSDYTEFADAVSVWWDAEP